MRKIGTYAVGVGLAVCLGVLPLAGCSQPAEEPVVEESGPAWSLAIGGDAEPGLVVSNGTDRAIVGVAVKDSAAVEYPVNLLVDGTVWESGATALICYPAVAEDMVVGDVAAGESADAQGEDDAAAASESLADELAVRQSYDIQLTAEDGTVYELHQVVADASMDNAMLVLDQESGLAYLTYTVDGAEASTLEAEKAYKAQVDASAAAAEAAAAQSYSYDYGGGSSYDDTPSGGSSGSDSVGQSGDTCIDEPAFR